MAKSGLNVYRQSLPPQPVRFLPELMAEARRLAEALGGGQAYYEWAGTLSRQTILDQTAYLAAIQAKLVEVEGAGLVHRA